MNHSSLCQGELSTGTTSQVSYSDINKIILLTTVSYTSNRCNKGEVCGAYDEEVPTSSWCHLAELWRMEIIQPGKKEKQENYSD